MRIRVKFAVAIGLVVCTSLFTGCSGGSSSSDTAASSEKANSLTILTWEGYTDDEWVSEFEKANNVTVNPIYIGTDDELLAKMRSSAGQIDIYGGARGYVHDLAEAGLILPLDVSQIPGYDTIEPAFRDNPMVLVDGTPYQVPMSWGDLGIAYAVDHFPTAPRSWKSVFEPAAEDCGKVMIVDDANIVISTAALYLGFSPVNELTDDQLEQVKQLLIKGRDCVSAYYSGPGDASNYFISGRGSIALSIGSGVAIGANRDSKIVANTIPKEKALGWSDGWSLSSGAKENGTEGLAYKWMAFMLEKKQQAAPALKWGYSPVVSAAGEVMTEQQIEDYNVGNAAFYNNLVALNAPQEPDSMDKRQAIWNLVKSGA